MNLDIILLIAVSSVFVGYLAVIISKFGVLKSISESYYRVHPVIFILFIWTIAVSLGIIGNTPLMFMAASFLCFVGAAPAFKSSELEERVHIVGASGGIILGFASLLLDFKLWYLVLIMAIFTLYASFIKLKNKTWWIECAAFVLIVLGLLIEKS
jgi:hypothetical protein